MMTDLITYKDLIIETAIRAYVKIMNLPDEIRKDDKVRTGIQVFVRQPGTRNLIYFSVAEPSDAAKVFSVEKAVRSHLRGDAASQNSENEEKMEFRGSLSAKFNGIEIEASTSGLLGSEDVAVGVLILAQIFNKTTDEICANVIERSGKIPATFFDERSYISKIVGAIK